MLNLAQRLFLGCVLLAGLIFGLLLVTHRALQASGQWKLALALAAAAILVELGTVFFVLRPIHGLATDALAISYSFIMLIVLSRTSVYLSRRLPS
jgi:hypothetical protein